MSISNATVGKTITKLRIRSGLTQQQLAAVLGVSHQAVSKWENGVTLPDIESILKLTNLFGVTMDQLLNGTVPGLYVNDTENETEKNAEPDPFENLYSFAGRAVKKAQSIGESIARKVTETLDNIDFKIEIDEDDDGVEEEPLNDVNDEPADDNTEGGAKGNLSLSAIIELAPFMSREKLDAMLLNCKETADCQQLIKLAPFISPSVLEELFVRGNTEIDLDGLSKLAPFMKKEQLFRILLDNRENLSIKTLRQFAPYLKKGMVDALVEAFIQVRSAVEKSGIIDKMEQAVETFKDNINQE